MPALVVRWGGTSIGWSREERTLDGLLPDLITSAQTYGYPALWLIVFLGAAGVPLPTDPLLLAAGAFMAEWGASLPVLALVALTAAVCGDSAGYLIGRKWGSEAITWLEHTDLGSHLLATRTGAKAKVYFEHYGGWAVFLSRSMLGAFSGVINVLAGSQLYPFRAFLAYDVAGELVDVIGMLAIGLAVRTGWEAATDDVRTLSLVAFGLLALAVLVVFVVRALKHATHRGRPGIEEAQQADAGGAGQVK